MYIHAISLLLISLHCSKKVNVAEVRLLRLHLFSVDAIIFFGCLEWVNVDLIIYIKLIVYQIR